MSDTPKPSAPSSAPADKPAILKSSEFTVEEGLAYRAMRTGAIWMNKLFFSSLILLVVWLALAASTGQTSCTDSYEVAEGENGTSQDVPAAKCSVFLTPTAKFLGAMAVLTFLASLAFGALGLVVGKRILEVAKSDEELGAGAPPPATGTGDGGTTDDEGAPDDGAGPGELPRGGP